MVVPGEKMLKQSILWCIFKEQFLNFLRKLAGKPLKPKSWESMNDSDKNQQDQKI